MDAMELQTIPSVTQSVTISSGPGSHLRVSAVNTGTLNRVFAFAFYALLASYVAFVLWLPVFPSQDGPVHIYYAAIANSLLHHESTYAAAFKIKHILPPYALHFYLLMAAMKVLSPVAADKFFACLCVIVLALGFRAMAFSFGPSAWMTSILAIPFCVHKYLFMGFYNFSLSIGIAFFAIAVWNSGGRSPSRR